MDIQRVELKRTPPREPLTSLEALVRDFKWRFPRERRDTVYTLCATAPNLRVAIKLATDSIKADGKHHNHQVKVRKESRDKLAGILTGYDKLNYMTNFHELWSLIDLVKPWGIGPLTVYDVATRIGAYLGLEPEYLYLHTGARAGLIALARSRRNGFVPAAYRTQPFVIQRHIEDLGLPGILTMDECEDFLCTYRTMFLDMFGGVRQNFERVPE